MYRTLLSAAEELTDYTACTQYKADSGTNTPKSRLSQLVCLPLLVMLMFHSILSDILEKLTAF